MSTDPSAILYYGFPFFNSDNYEEENDDDYDQNSYFDLNSEWEKLKSPKQPESEYRRNSEEWDKWREQKNVWDASIENIKIDVSGSEHSETHYVNAESLSHQVEWDEQKSLADIDLGPQPEADKQIKEFCHRFGIVYQQPGWHLAASYF